ncbi:hypothetical protein ABS784_15375 [Geobacillus sp. G4]|uniref:hypothetical protein n=1 Tax=Geobacillus sp. G4 TaxID=3169691 RepID=UPI00333903B2
MHDNERRLSDYIDQLNAEKKPKDHEHLGADPELQKLFHTVRLVRSLREPAMPERDFPAKLVRVVTGSTSANKTEKEKTGLDGQHRRHRGYVDPIAADPFRFTL